MLLIYPDKNKWMDSVNCDHIVKLTVLFFTDSAQKNDFFCKLDLTILLHTGSYTSIYHI